MGVESKARELECEGDYYSAIEFYQQELNTLQSNNPQRGGGIKISIALQQMADLQARLGEFDVAIASFKKAIETYRACQASLTQIYQGLGNCHTSIGICYLAQSNFKIALPFFEKAIEYTEKMMQLDEYVENYSSLGEFADQIVFSLALCILCLINLNRDLIEIMPYLIKAIELIEVHNLSGFSTDWCRFFSHVLNGNKKEAHRLFKNNLMKATKSPLPNSTFHNTILGLFTQFAANHVPAARIPSYKLKEQGRVLLTRQVLEDMLIYALTYANRTMNYADYREVIALIVGKIKKDDVVITEIIPMTSGTETEVEFKEEDYAKAAEINEEVATRGEFIVGWFHTHPALGLFLSPADIMNQLGYQSLNEKAIAIVYDFTRVTPTHPGFLIFRLDEATITTGAYHIISWKCLDRDDFPYSYFVSFFPKFIAQLNHILRQNQTMTLTDCAQTLNRSPHLLREVIPKLIEFHHLPNTQFDLDAEIIRKTPVPPL
ncbi:MAG: hypothetical protein ACTSRS_08845 [Candidatus Helarchaeota archaeon]